MFDYVRGVFRALLTPARLRAGGRCGRLFWTELLVVDSEDL